MPTWAKTVFRTFGVMNVTLAALGFYWLILSVFRVVRWEHPKADAPYFALAFGVMVVSNICFLALFVFAAFRLVTLARSGVTLQWVTSVSLFAYTVLHGGLWMAGWGIGRSIAYAGLADMGIASFAFLFGVPYLYPIVSSIVLLATRWRVPAH